MIVNLSTDEILKLINTTNPHLTFFQDPIFTGIRIFKLHGDNIIWDIQTLKETYSDQQLFDIYTMAKNYKPDVMHMAWQSFQISHNESIHHSILETLQKHFQNSLK